MEGKGLPRLTRRPEFLLVAGSGRKAVLPGVVLQARPRSPDSDAAAPDGGQTPRFGFTATRKIGGAVVRNRARRRLKAAAQLLGARLARPGVDYVLIARAGTLSRAWPKLLRDVEQAFERVLTAPPRTSS
ncbi:MAG: ribonuclease P protein component [Alphaproteobacteria bacterium]|nr:ribonuclease P protein component [Alphaproteobacteria bacterium]